MTAPTKIYIDPSLAGNVGTGTIVDPYGDVQYALNTATRDSTNGNVGIVKSGTAELLAAALSWATFGTPTNLAPFVFQSCASFATPDDSDFLAGTGITTIDGGGGACVSVAVPYVHWRHFRFTNGGSSNLYTAGDSNTFFECEIDGTTGSGIVAGNNGNRIEGCHFHNIGNRGVDGTAAATYVLDSYFQNGTNDFTAALYLASDGCTALRNIISIDGASDGIVHRGKNTVSHNSILSNGGTGQAIQVSAAGAYYGSILASNVIEGFSGVGGIGVDFASPTSIPAVLHNSVYNCTTAYSADNSRRWIDRGNETLSASPFRKSGADSFANRFTYFAPVAGGSVLYGAYPSGSGLDRGAVQMMRAVNFFGAWLDDTETATGLRSGSDGGVGSIDQEV